MAQRVGALVAPTINYGYKSVPCMVRFAAVAGSRVRIAPLTRAVSRQGGGPYIGTTGLGGSTLTALLRDVVRELTRHGVRRILVLVRGSCVDDVACLRPLTRLRPSFRANRTGTLRTRCSPLKPSTWCVLQRWHAAACFAARRRDAMLTRPSVFYPMHQAMRDAVAAGVADLQLLRLEYWDHVTPETTARVFPNGYPGAQLEHAAVQETSLMLVVQPHLVDLAAIPGAGRHPADRVAAFPAYTIEPAEARPDWAPFSGVLSPANAASRDKGEWLMADHVAGIESALRTEWGTDALAGLEPSE